MSIMTTHMIGHLKGVRKVELDGFVDGKWTENIPQIELTVASESVDLDGQPVFSMDKFTLDSKHYNNYKALENKVVAVPYVLKTSKKGQTWEYDESMPILELKDTLLNMVSSKK